MLRVAVAAFALAALFVVVLVGISVAPDEPAPLSPLDTRVLASMAPCARFGVQKRACDGSDHETAKWRGAARTSFVYHAPRSTAHQLQARPNARTLSNVFCAQPTHVGRHATLRSLVWSFGQFLDHAITRVAASQHAADAIAIDVTGDAHFDPRSDGATIRSDGIAALNEITHFVDGNVLYGSDASTVMELREWSGGRLRVEDGALPPHAAGSSTARSVGDTRGNEHPVLLALHTLFVREHNTQARRLEARHADWNDECLFNAARTIVEAEFRAIVFNEFVPALLGAPLPPPRFNATCSVEIAAEFAGAAYRLHTLVNEELVAYNATDGRRLDALALRDAFDRNEFLERHGVGALLLGQLRERSERFDAHLVDSLRQHLFPAHGVPLDLAALNIERGRRLAIADFSALRHAYGLDALDSLDELGADAHVLAALRSQYASARNVDAWIGMHVEAVPRGATLPPTIAAVLADQFRRLRDCDPVYFKDERDAALRAYVREHGSLRALLLRNTDIAESQLPAAAESLFTVAAAP